MLVKGMFPGLELTNDDEGVNVRLCRCWRCWMRSAPAMTCPSSCPPTLATLGQFADKVILLNRRVLKSGPPDEVLSSPEFYETFHLRVGKGDRHDGALVRTGGPAAL